MEQVQALPRQKAFFSFARALARPVMRLLLNYRYEPLPETEEACLVLSNHNTDLDCVLVALSSKRFLRFVATEKVTRMGFVGKLVERYFDPILHFKGKQGFKTVKSILSSIKGGVNVVLFPEGNRSFNGLTCPIPPATSKMVRACGGTLVTYRLRGGYFSSPRWGKGLRRGRMTGTVAGVYPSEMLKAMRDDEIRAIIERDLYVDAYADQQEERVAFKGRNAAEGLESTLFMCPDCRSIGTLVSSGNRIGCSCGFSAEYDAFGYVTDRKGVKHTVTELDLLQREAIHELAEAGEDRPVFSDRVTCETISQDHRVLTAAQTELTARPEGLTFLDQEVPYGEIEGIAINQRNLLILQRKGEPVHYEFSGPVSFSALKYLYMVREREGSATGTL